MYLSEDLTLEQVRSLLARLVDEPGRAPEIVPSLAVLLAGSGLALALALALLKQ